MMTEPAGAYFASANTGFATAIRRRVLIENIFLTLTGLRLAGTCSRAQRGGLPRLRQDAASQQLIS
jgi:hypothetical protein